MNFKEKFEDFCSSIRSNIHRVRGFFERLVDAFYMFNVIRKCVAWDQSSLFEIMEQWMSRMQICHEQDTWHVCANKKVKEIRLARALLRRIIEDDYPVMNLHYEKWGGFDWPSDKEIEGMGDFIPADMLFRRKNANTPELKAQERNEFMRAIKHSDYLYGQDLDYFCKLLRHRSSGWWT